MKRNAFLLIAALASPALAQAADSCDAAAGATSFTAEQAERGRAGYAASCAKCHGVALLGPIAPVLKGQAFTTRWKGRSIDALYNQVTTTMPPGQAGSLAPDEYSDLLAFLLASNGVAPAKEPYDGTATHKNCVAAK